MNEVKPNPQVLHDALLLAEDALSDLEMARLSLSAVAMKVSRLARMLEDAEAQRIFHYEASGYPFPPGGFTPDTWRLLQAAGRIIETKNPATNEIKTQGYADSIESLESLRDAQNLSLQSAVDRNISVSSANPNQVVFPPLGNQYERSVLRNQIVEISRKISSRRTFIYDYVSSRYIELKYSQLAFDLFSAVRMRVDPLLAELLPQTQDKLSSIYDNLSSENSEDWSNAAHSCRKVLQDLADVVFPPSSEIRSINKNGKRLEIKLGKEHSLNRLTCFVEDNSDSDTYRGIVGSNISFLGDRLDAVLKGAQKGSHGTISKPEADRYVIHTYLLVGDILDLYRSTRDRSRARD